MTLGWPNLSTTGGPVSPSAWRSEDASPQPIPPSPPCETGALLLPVIPPGTAYPTIEQPLIDARSAMAEALIAYLGRAEFCRWSGGVMDPETGRPVPNTPFRLSRVYRQWPEPDREMDYPVATVLDSDVGALEAFALVPAPLEETFDPIARSVIWKTAEAMSLFQVDVWCNDDPTREAIAATLPGLFAPGEDQYGVFLQGPPTYFSRPVRLTLESMQRMDTEASVYVRERRLMVQVRGHVDVVHRRCGSPVTVRATVHVQEG